MELILILLGAAGIGYLISTGSRAPVGSGSTTAPAPASSPDCTTAINTLPEPLRSAVQSAVASPASTRDTLMNLAKTLDTCPYPTIKDQCAFVAACIRAEAAKKPMLTSGTTVDDSTCATLIEALPETTEDEKTLKTSIKTVWASPVIIPSAVVTLADTIDKMAEANASSDPTASARLKLIAGCMRTKAAKAAGGVI